MADLNDKRAGDIPIKSMTDSVNCSGKLSWFFVSIVLISASILMASNLGKPSHGEKTKAEPKAEKRTDNEEKIEPKKPLCALRVNKQTLGSLNLQEILNKNCIKRGLFYAIKPEHLPVTFDSKIIRLDLADAAYLICEGAENRLYVKIQYYPSGEKTSLLTMIMYDDSSQELGHGPPPFMRKYGEKIDRDDSSDIDLFIYVHYYDIGPTLTDHTWVIIRGIKTYRNRGQTIFYLCKDIDVIDLTDSRFKKIVDKYGKPVTQKEIMGEKLSDYADKKMLDRKDENVIIGEVISVFFKKMDHLDSLYKERVRRLEKDLNAVSLKIRNDNS